jgi:hypothetical protein
MTGLFAQQSVNEAGGADGAFYGRPVQLWYQIAGILTAIGKWKTVLYENIIEEKEQFSSNWLVKKLNMIFLKVLLQHALLEYLYLYI